MREYEAPRGETEQKLAGIWEEVLKVERVGRHDNFFELGGHSLLAMRVIGILAQKGTAISVEIPFLHQTIAALAAYVGEVETKKNANNQATPLRVGGSQFPVFLIHPGDGEIVYASKLAKHLDLEFGVYGLAAKPAHETQLRTVEGLAARFVRMIREVQPVGPYQIVGYCFGGVIAYEIATQLIGADQDIGFLGLLDTLYAASLINDKNARLVPDANSPANYNDHLLFVLGDYEGDDESRESLAALKLVSKEMDFESFVRKCREVSLLPQMLVNFTTKQIQEFLDRASSFGMANLNYRAQPLPIPVHLFKPFDKSPEREGPDPFLGWTRVQPADLISLIPLRGNHSSIMEGSNIQLLGKTLSSAIRTARVSTPKLPEKTYSPIAILKHGLPRISPLFCVPGAGASVTSFVPLVSSLSEELPVYGIQPRGLDAILVPHSTIEAMAESCLQGIDQVHPTGEVHLLGHSIGGWVAFEIARRLSFAGRFVASLTIIDTEVPDNEASDIREYDRKQILTKWIEVIELTLDRALGVDLDSLIFLDESAQREILHRHLVDALILPKRSSPDTLVGLLRTFARSLRIRYSPEKYYDSFLRLVLVDDKRLGPDANIRKHSQVIEGWKRLVSNVEHIHAPGNHMTVLKWPHIQAIARLVDHSVPAYKYRAASGR